MLATTITVLSMLFSVLVPQRMWYSPSAPISIDLKTDKDVTLVVTDAAGKSLEGCPPLDAKANSSVDLRLIYPDITSAGTYILYAVARGSAPKLGAPTDFLGTPIVVEVLPRARQDATPMVVRVVPLCSAVIHTDAGDMTAGFYYDVAPHTVDAFLTLAGEGFYDGLDFHRIVPGFVIQGGDPIGNGTGGPDYHLDAEFNGKPHLEGVLSMARNGDPNEDPGQNIPPAPQYANSAGSQFFICLDYKNTQSLDRHYTAFGKLTDGFDVLEKIGGSKIADEQTGTPKIPTIIKHIEVLPVTAKNNPYAILNAPATRP